MHDTFPVWIGPLRLEGELIAPDGHHSLIIFDASGWASSTGHNTAAMLADAGFGSLLFPARAADRPRAGDGERPLRARDGRMTDAIDWVRSQPRYRGIRIGLLGVGQDAGLALEAAAARPYDVSYVAIWDGGGDVDWAALAAVRAPTLLIADKDDLQALTWSRRALRKLGVARLDETAGAASGDLEKLQKMMARAIAWFCAV